MAAIARILIVDDHASVRDGIRAYIEVKTNFTICGEAESGPSAIRAANALQPDVIILDLVLPMLNGVEVASLLKRNLPRVKIIAFSVFADELARAAKSVGRIDAVMPKTSPLAALMQTIRDLTTPARVPPNPDTPESPVPG